ncbi:MAG: hypothetical protein U0840_13820 [Gemmataceae bacterium]
MPTSGRIICGLRAHGAVSLSLDEIAAMRRSPLQGCGEPFSISALKHIDEQTLGVLAALQAAMRSSGLPGEPGSSYYAQWGALAAPRYLGRAMMSPSVARFKAEGAWGVSPHMVPYRSLHSISGTVSQFLSLHGPNFGVGGGDSGVAELLLTGMPLLASMRLPGLWLVASRVEPEQTPTEEGRPAAGSYCQAVALALVPESEPASHRLELLPRGMGSACFDLATLATWLDSPGTMFDLGGAGQVALFPHASSRDARYTSLISSVASAPH